MIEIKRRREKREHYVVVYEDEDYLAHLARLRPVTDADRADAYTAGIECAAGGCGGWIECDKPHDGYDPEDETSPVYDEYEDVKIHGVTHEWRWGYGWTIDFHGCPVQQQIGWDVPDGIPMDRPGRYLIDIDWDDADCYMALVREITKAEAESH